MAIIESPTGSGKTTLLPVILHQNRYTRSGKIAITQPRRIAAVSVCRFIQEFLHKEDETFVGYKMRFEDTTTAKTKIKILTDGTLLQEIKTDPYLTEYTTLIIDEAHERSLTIDFILGIVKNILQHRSDFKVIISSATINTRVFSAYFDDCPIITIDARSFPVKEFFLKEDPKTKDDLSAHLIRTVRQHVHNKYSGDILAFLPGEMLIRNCLHALKKQKWARRLHVLALYARMNSQEQEQVFYPAPGGKTKVILATNIAETSITIDGITSVIDSGLAKVNFYHAQNSASSLIETFVSRSSADQRKGRSGRTQKGRCFFLYSRESYLGRPMFPTEEIYRTDLTEVVLRMADLGIHEIENFDFISTPEKNSIHSAIKELRNLNAITENRTLTRIGTLMLSFPLLPRHSRIVVESMLHFPEALADILTIISVLTSNSPLLLPIGEEHQARAAHAQFNDPRGDFAAYLNLIRSYEQSENPEEFCRRFYLDCDGMQEIIHVNTQLTTICHQMGSFIPEKKATYQTLMLCITRGFSNTICAYVNKRNGYQSSTLNNIYLHPGTLITGKNPPFIVAAEIVTTTRTFARLAGTIEPSWVKHTDKKLLHLMKRQKEKKGPQKRWPKRRRR